MFAAIILTGLLSMIFSGLLYPSGIKNLQFSFLVKLIYYFSGAVSFFCSLFPGHFISSFILLLLSGTLFWSGYEIERKVKKKKIAPEGKASGTNET